jgi:hypothetical protein
VSPGRDVQLRRLRPPQFGGTEITASEAFRETDRVVRHGDVLEIDDAKRVQHYGILGLALHGEVVRRILVKAAALGHPVAVEIVPRG